MKKIKYFDEWCYYWLEVYKKRTVRPTTYDSYLIAAKHIKKIHVKLKRLKVHHLQTVINYMLDLNLSRSTIKHTVTIMTQAAQAAVQHKLCKDLNCSLLVFNSARKSSKICAYTPSEQFELISHTSNSFYGDLFVFLLLTGMRVGEALALTWPDVNLRNRVIRINKSLYRGKMTTPKTFAGAREIPITDDVFRILRRNYELNTEYVWRNTFGQAINYRSLLKCFHRYCSLCGVPERGIHTLRHTYATNALSAGVNPKVLSELLGHATVGVTLGIYTDVRADHKLKAAIEMEKYLEKNVISASKDDDRIIDFKDYTAFSHGL